MDGASPKRIQFGFKDFVVRREQPYAGSAGRHPNSPGTAKRTKKGISSF